MSKQNSSFTVKGWLFCNTDKLMDSRGNCEKLRHHGVAFGHAVGFYTMEMLRLFSWCTEIVLRVNSMVYTSYPSKVLTLFTAALTAAILTFSSPATAQTSGKGSRSDGEASFSVIAYNNLLWRGQALNTGASIQPMADIVWKGFGFNIWTNYDYDLGYIKETDYTLNFAAVHNKLRYDVGVIYYGLRKSTTEFYLSVNYDVILAPYATFYLDVDAGKGGFLIVGIGHPFVVADAIAIDLGAYVGVNFDNAAMGFDENGKRFTNFYNMNLSAKTSIPFAGDWSFDIQLEYSFALTDASRSGIRSASATGDKNFFLYGAGVTLAF